MANLIKSRRACSGFLTSLKEPHVFITPTTKNRTNKASPIACIAPLIFMITFHIEPPLKSCGCVATN